MAWTTGPDTIKLLHVSPYALQDPLLGGVPQAVGSICDALSYSGHDVTIWASDVGNPKSAGQCGKASGVKTQLFRARINVLGDALNSPLVPQLMFLDPGMIQEFDLVHLHGYWSSFTPSVALACRRAGMPLILQPHGTLVKSGQKEVAKRIFQLLFKRQVEAALRAIVALSDGEKNQVLVAGFEPRLVRIIPNPLPIPEVVLPVPSAARRELGLPAGAMIILYLGRLHPAKGLRELMTAYSLVRREIPHALLVIAGPDEGMLSELVNIKRDAGLDGVSFLGPLVGTQKWLALRAADVLCLPSRYEALPVSVMEAVVAETAFVVSKSVELAGLTEGSSYIASVLSPEALAECLIKLLNDSELRLRLRTNAGLEAQRNFNPTEIVSRLEDVYQQALLGG